MVTCKECSRYGKVQQKPQRQGNNKRNKNNQNRRTNSNRPYTRKSKEEEYELVDDYEKTIKQAREKKNLTHKQLGEKIYERESVIANIETGKMVPDNKIAHKLEKALHIKIIEKIESNEREFQESRRFKEATLGDIARIKRK